MKRFRISQLGNNHPLLPKTQSHSVCFLLMIIHLEEILFLEKKQSKVCVSEYNGFHFKAASYFFKVLWVFS